MVGEPFIFTSFCRFLCRRQTERSVVTARIARALGFNMLLGRQALFLMVNVALGFSLRPIDGRRRHLNTFYIPCSDSFTQFSRAAAAHLDTVKTREQRAAVMNAFRISRKSGTKKNCLFVARATMNASFSRWRRILKFSTIWKMDGIGDVLFGLVLSDVRQEIIYMPCR